MLVGLRCGDAKNQKPSLKLCPKSTPHITSVLCSHCSGRIHWVYRRRNIFVYIFFKCAVDGHYSPTMQYTIVELPTDCENIKSKLRMIVKQLRECPRYENINMKSLEKHVYLMRGSFLQVNWHLHTYVVSFSVSMKQLSMLIYCILKTTSTEILCMLDGIGAHWLCISHITDVSLSFHRRATLKNTPNSSSHIYIKRFWKITACFSFFVCLRSQKDGLIKWSINVPSAN